jgi:hypothetical protein
MKKFRRHRRVRKRAEIRAAIGVFMSMNLPVSIVRNINRSRYVEKQKA